MRYLWLAGAIGLAVSVAPAQQLRVSGLPAGPEGLTAYSVSNDGQLVVGYGWNQYFVLYPVAWTPGQVPFVLSAPLVNSLADEAYGVSGDGSTIVGVTRHPTNYYNYPTVWRLTEGSWTYQHLPVPQPSDGRARAASNDGRVVVGQTMPMGRYNIFPARWRETASGWQLTDAFSLGCPFGGIATGVTADGEWVIGWACEGSTYYTRAFVARSASEITVLPLSPPDNSSQAWGISANGDVIVGWSYITGSDPAVPRACRWRKVGNNWVHERLPALRDTLESYAYAVSADGRVIVGYDFTTARYYRALIWIDGQVHVMQSLYSALVPWNFYLSYAYDVSANGRYVVGTIYNGNARRFEMFWLDRGCQVPGDANGDGQVNNADLLLVLFAFGQTGSNLPADLNRDGQVNNADLLLVLFNFGANC
ncbi:MAG: dockerin type I domain-containing protein [Armatimonadota bacterium]|nr:dockerin type I domain-containing protein [Armatimonadota bacterium]